MPLSFWDEASPNIEVLHSPFVRPLEENVVRHDVVVAKCWHDRDHIVIDPSAILIRHAKHLCKLLYQELILAYDLLLRACMLFVVVVSRRVARPDDKVDIVLDIVLDPSKCLIDERKRRIAA